MQEKVVDDSEEHEVTDFARKVLEIMKVYSIVAERIVI